MCCVTTRLMPCLSNLIASSAPTQFTTGDGDDSLLVMASATTLSLRSKMLLFSSLVAHLRTANLTAHASSGPYDADSFHGTPSHFASASSGISKPSMIVKVGPASVMMA